MGGIKGIDLTKEDRVSIESFLKNGYKIGGIAEILSRSHSCIKQEIKKNGGRSIYSADVAHRAALERKEAATRKKNKGFTEEHISKIHSLLLEKISINKISEITGISAFRISAHLKRNNITTTPMHYTGFDNRIRALEEQMQIVLDILKEIHVKN